MCATFEATSAALTQCFPYRLGSGLRNLKSNRANLLSSNCAACADHGLGCAARDSTPSRATPRADSNADWLPDYGHEMAGKADLLTEQFHPRGSKRIICSNMCICCISLFKKGWVEHKQTAEDQLPLATCWCQDLASACFRSMLAC